MTPQRCLLALLFIAISPYSSWARAEKVYKCGSTYSQTPCRGSTTLEVEDARDPLEKKRMDAQTQRDAELARDMEQSRLANEAALAAERTQQAQSAAKRRQKIKDAAAAVAATEPVLVHAHKPKLNRPHKPTGFTAVVPGSVHKTTKRRKKLTEDTR